MKEKDGEKQNIQHLQRIHKSYYSILSTCSVLSWRTENSSSASECFHRCLKPKTPETSIQFNGSFHLNHHFALFQVSFLKLMIVGRRFTEKPLVLHSQLNQASHLHILCMKRPSPKKSMKKFFLVFFFFYCYWHVKQASLLNLNWSLYMSP